jgi:hypothetical protein
MSERGALGSQMPPSGDLESEIRSRERENGAMLGEIERGGWTGTRGVDGH